MSDLTPQTLEPSISINRLKIGNAQVQFDFNGYWHLSSDLAKKKQLLAALYLGLFSIAEEISLETEQLKVVKDILLDNDITTEFLWGRGKWNKSKSLKAQVYYPFNLSNIELGISIFDKEGQLTQEYKLEETRPHYMFVEPFLGRLNWVSEFELELISKDKEDKLPIYLTNM